MDAAFTHAHLSRTARLRRVAFSPKTLWQLARDSVLAWIDDFAPSMGAAIAYYTAFSIAPLLLIVIALLGLAFGHDAATRRIFTELSGTLGPEAAATLEDMVRGATGTGKSVFGTIVGVAAMLVGATTVFVELQSDLDRIWRSPAAASNGGVIHLLTQRFLSVGMIVAVGFLLLISLLVSSGLSALGEWWAPLFGGWEIVLQIANFVVSLVVVTMLFALVYKVLPRVKIGWEDVWIGAAVTALLFSIGKLLIGLYVGKSALVSSFGAAGSVLVLLIWVYYSAQIFLLGAEFTWHYAYRFGSRRGEEVPAAAAAKSAVARAGTAPAAASVPATTSRSPPADTAPESAIARARPRRSAYVAAAALASGALAGGLLRRYAPWRRLSRKIAR